MAIVHVGGTNNATGSLSPVQTIDVTYTASAGNLCVITLGVVTVSGTLPTLSDLGSNEPSFPTVADTVGTKWETILSSRPFSEFSTGAGYVNHSVWQLFHWYCKASVSGANTITFTLPGDPAFLMASIDEYSGLSASGLDAISVKWVNTSTTTGSGSLVTTNANELLYCASAANGSAALTPTNGFINRQAFTSGVIVSGPQGASQFYTFDKTVSSTGTYNATFSHPLANGVEPVTTLISFSSTPIAQNDWYVQLQQGFALQRGTNSGKCFVTMPFNTTAGNVLMMTVSELTGTITDNQGNTWDFLYKAPFFGSNTFVYSTVAKTGSLTVTVPCTGAVSLFELHDPQPLNNYNWNDSGSGGTIVTLELPVNAGVTIFSVLDTFPGGHGDFDISSLGWLNRTAVFYNSTLSNNLFSMQESVQIVPTTDFYQNFYTATGASLAMIFGVSFTPPVFLLMITADDQSKPLGTLFTFIGTEFTNTTLESGDSISSCTITSTGAPANAPVGSYPILISDAVGVGLDKYTITYVPGTMIVFGSPPPNCFLIDYPFPGPYKDAEGNVLANGYLLVRLVFDCNCPCADYQITGNNHSRILLDEEGMVTGNPQIRPNDQLKPNNSYYIVQGFSSLGELVYGPEKLVV